MGRSPFKPGARRSRVSIAERRVTGGHPQAAVSMPTVQLNPNGRCLYRVRLPGSAGTTGGPATHVGGNVTEMDKRAGAHRARADSPRRPHVAIAVVNLPVERDRRVIRETKALEAAGY